MEILKPILDLLIFKTRFSLAPLAVAGIGAGISGIGSALSGKGGKRQAQAAENIANAQLSQRQREIGGALGLSARLTGDTSLLEENLLDLELQRNQLIEKIEKDTKKRKLGSFDIQKKADKKDVAALQAFDNEIEKLKKQIASPSLNLATATPEEKAELARQQQIAQQTQEQVSALLSGEPSALTAAAQRQVDRQQRITENQLRGLVGGNFAATSFGQQALGELAGRQSEILSDERQRALSALAAGVSAQLGASGQALSSLQGTRQLEFGLRSQPIGILTGSNLSSLAGGNQLGALGSAGALQGIGGGLQNLGGTILGKGIEKAIA